MTPDRLINFLGRDREIAKKWSLWSKGAVANYSKRAAELRKARYRKKMLAKKHAVAAAQAETMLKEAQDAITETVALAAAASLHFEQNLAVSLVDEPLASDSAGSDCFHGRFNGRLVIL